MASNVTSPRIVAVAKPAPGGAKVGGAVAVGVKPAAAKPAVAKAAGVVAKLPAELTASATPRADSGILSPGITPRTEAVVGLAKPVTAGLKKPPPNFAKKPAAPSADGAPAAINSPPSNVSVLKKSSGVLVAKRPGGASSKGTPSISTLRNRWEHTTSTAGSSLSDAKITMCEKKNLQSLLKLHRCNNVRVQSLTQEVLDNLVELPTGELCMEMKNGFRPLVDLTKFSEEDIQVWALWALANLAAHAPCQVAIVMEVGWHNIKTRYAASPLDEMKQATCLLLSNLSHSQKVQQGIIEKGVPILMTFVKYQDENIIEWPLRALAEVSVIKEYGAKEVWDNELLPVLIPHVLNDENPDVQLPAVHILCNICADHTLPVQNKVVSSGVVDVLVNLLNNDNQEMVAYAAMTLAHLAKSAAGANEIKASGGHSALIPLLDSSNQFVQIGVATAINNLADFREVGLLMKQQDAVEPLSEIILSTPSEAVEQQASQALEKLDKEAWKFVEKKLLGVTKSFRSSVKFADAADVAIPPPPPPVDDADDADARQKAEEKARKEREDAQRKLQEEEAKRAAALAKKAAEDAKLAEQQKLEEEQRAEQQKAAEEARKKKFEEEERKRREEDERRRKREAEEDELRRKRNQEEDEKRHSKIKADEEERERKRKLEEEADKEKKRKKEEEEHRKKKEKEEEEERKKKEDHAKRAVLQEEERQREDEARKKMYDRLKEEEKLERSRMELQRQHEEEKRKLDDQKRQIGEEKRRLELMQSQREEEDKIRAQKDAVERELDDKRKSLLQHQLEEEKRKSEERLREELEKVERQKRELELEKKKLEESRSRELSEEKRLMEERMKLEKELLEKARKALDEEKKLIEKLQKEKEEEERIRGERLKMEHEIEMKKLAAEKSRLEQEKQKMDEDVQAEKQKLERHKEDLLADLERRKKDELDRISREQELQSLMKNASGNMYADEIKAMEARMKADREALENERKLLVSMREDKLAMEREKDNIERARQRYEEERRLREQEDYLRRQQELMEIEALKRKIEEDQKRADEEKRRFQENEADFLKKMEEEKLKLERSRKQLEDDNKDNNKSEDDEKRIAAELGRLEEEKDRLARDRETFEAMRKRLFDVEEKGDAARMREIELLIQKEEEARQHAEGERKRLEELERNIQDERRKAEEQKQAIQSLLEHNEQLPNIGNAEDEEVERLRRESEDLRRELERVKQEKAEGKEQGDDDVEAKIQKEIDKRMKAQKRTTERDLEQITNALADKEFDLAMRERKLRDAEGDLMKMMGKLEQGYDSSSARGRSVDSSRSRSRSSSRSRSDSVDSRERAPRRRRRSTSVERKDLKSRSRSRTRSRSLTPSSAPDYTETITDDRNSSYSRYTSESKYEDDDTYTRTMDLVSDDDDDDDRDTSSRTDSSFYERSPFDKKKKNLKSPSLNRRGRKRDQTETASEYTESQWSDDDLKKSANSIGKFAKSPRASNYPDTPDGFDGGILSSDYEETDNDSVASMEGLVESDPHKAARELMKLLAEDETRKLREPSLESLQKFARARGGEPTQFEAREIIPVLLNVLNVYPDRSHQNIISITLLILAILAYNKDVNQLYIRRENGGHTLIDLLNFPIVIIKARAALAVAAYTLNNALIKRECAPSIPKLLELLQEHSGDEPLKMAVCAALASLADDNKENQKRILNNKGVKLIMSLIASNQIPPKYAVNLLAALSHRNKAVQNQVREGYKGIFRKIVRLLSPYSKPRLLQAAVQALVELVRKNTKNKKEMAKAQAVPFLVNLLTSKNNQYPELVAGALYLCWACAKYLPNKFQNEEFRNPRGGIEEVIAPLRNMESEQVQKVIEQIDNKLARHAGN